MAIVEELLSARGSELIQGLTERAGFSGEEAGRFLPPAAEQVLEQVRSGGFEVGSLLGGDGLSSLISQLDLSALASHAGIDESKVSTGLQSVVPVLMSALQSKAGGVEDFVSQLSGGDGGDARAAGGVLRKLGGLFKR